MKIRLRDIDSPPCMKYLLHVNINYGHGRDVEFDPIEVFENVHGGSHHGDVDWLMRHCRKARTPEMVEYYISKKPNGPDVCRLLRDFVETNTPELLEYYKSTDPIYSDVSLMIARCEFAQTEEMLKYYRSLYPIPLDIDWLISHCEFAKKNKRLLT